MNLLLLISINYEFFDEPTQMQPPFDLLTQLFILINDNVSYNNEDFASIDKHPP